MKKAAVWFITLACLQVAQAAPEVVVTGSTQKTTQVHLAAGQVLVVQVEPALEYADPIPGRKWRFQAPKQVPPFLKLLGETDQGKRQIFRFQCLKGGHELLRLPLFVWKEKDGYWDGPARTCDLEVMSP